jgi:peptidoglycan/xylan/chitin deacetylase (PgdA/CDA1 family)
VAAPILDEAGVRAIFFVVPGFSSLPREDSRHFYRERMRKPHGTASAMTPSQIRDLAARGHTIGNHTLSHAWLRETARSEYEREIVESAAIIESWTGRPVDAFAWPFTWNAITPEAYRVAAARHRYCFAPCAGRVQPGDARGIIWRTNIEASSSPEEIRFQCSALADRAAASRRRDLVDALIPSPTQREAA